MASDRILERAKAILSMGSIKRSRKIKNMKKVAFVLTNQNNGNRTYIAVEKSGNEVFRTTVADCGFGAKLAHDLLKAKGYEATTAEWAIKIIREHHKAKQTW